MGEVDALCLAWVCALYRVLGPNRSYKAPNPKPQAPSYFELKSQFRDLQIQHLKVTIKSRSSEGLLDALGRTLAYGVAGFLHYSRFLVEPVT